MCNHLFWTLTLFCVAPSSVSLALFCECLKRALLLFSDLFTRETKIPYRGTCCYHRDNRWYGNRHPLMLLSEGKVGFQMSEELMLQWDSAPLGEKSEQTFSCLSLFTAGVFYWNVCCFFMSWEFAFFLHVDFIVIVSWVDSGWINPPLRHLETRTLWLFKQQTS